MARRNKADIERDEKMRETLKTQLGNLVHRQWDEMKDATGGEISISIAIDKATNSCRIITGFQKSVSAEQSFKLDDGQASLELPKE